MTPVGGGRFITLEGGEASGKSTQARLLAERMGAVLTHEPGGTALGRRIRELVLGQGPEMDPRTEALLMMADRCEHVVRVVEPALAQGRHVVSDRYSGSTLAYQGYGRGLDVSDLARMSRWASGGRRADLVLFIDVPRHVARARLGNPGDRIEAQGEEFHLRVAQGYRELAAADPRRWVVVDGAGNAEAVAAAITEVVAGRGWL